MTSTAAAAAGQVKGATSFRHGTPSRVFPYNRVFLDDEEGHVYRLVDERGKQWGFYNDHPTQPVRVVVTFRVSAPIQIVPSSSQQAASPPRTSPPPPLPEKPGQYTLAALGWTRITALAPETATAFQRENGARPTAAGSASVAPRGTDGTTTTSPAPPPSQAKMMYQARAVAVVLPLATVPFVQISSLVMANDAVMLYYLEDEPRDQSTLRFVGGRAPNTGRLVRGPDPSVMPRYTRVYSYFHSDGKDLLFRLVDDESGTWGFYNDTTKYRMRVATQFADGEEVEALGETKTKSITTVLSTTAVAPRATSVPALNQFSAPDSKNPVAAAGAPPPPPPPPPPSFSMITESKLGSLLRGSVPGMYSVRNPLHGNMDNPVAAVGAPAAALGGGSNSGPPRESGSPVLAGSGFPDSVTGSGTDAVVRGLSQPASPPGDSVRASTREVSPVLGANALIASPPPLSAPAAVTSGVYATPIPQGKRPIVCDLVIPPLSTLLFIRGDPSSFICSFTGDPVDNEEPTFESVRFQLRGPNQDVIEYDQLFKCYKHRENGLLFRLVDTEGQRWAFYNDTDRYVFTIRARFPLSSVRTFTPGPQVVVIGLDSNGGRDSSPPGRFSASHERQHMRYGENQNRGKSAALPTTSPDATFGVAADEDGDSDDEGTRDLVHSNQFMYKLTVEPGETKLFLRNGLPGAFTLSYHAVGARDTMTPGYPSRLSPSSAERDVMGTEDDYALLPLRPSDVRYVCGGPAPTVMLPSTKVYRCFQNGNGLLFRLVNKDRDGCARWYFYNDTKEGNMVVEVTFILGSDAFCHDLPTPVEALGRTRLLRAEMRRSASGNDVGGAGGARRKSPPTVGSVTQGSLVLPSITSSIMQNTASGAARYVVACVTVGPGKTEPFVRAKKPNALDEFMLAFRTERAPDTDVRFLHPAALQQTTRALGMEYDEVYKMFPQTGNGLVFRLVESAERVGRRLDQLHLATHQNEAGSPARRRNSLNAAMLHNAIIDDAGKAAVVRQPTRWAFYNDTEDVCFIVTVRFDSRSKLTALGNTLYRTEHRKVDRSSRSKYQPRSHAVSSAHTTPKDGSLLLSSAAKRQLSPRRGGGGANGGGSSPPHQRQQRTQPFGPGNASRGRSSSAPRDAAQLYAGNEKGGDENNEVDDVYDSGIEDRSDDLDHSSEEDDDEEGDISRSGNDGANDTSMGARTRPIPASEGTAAELNAMKQRLNREAARASRHERVFTVTVQPQCTEMFVEGFIVGPFTPSVRADAKRENDYITFESAEPIIFPGENAYWKYQHAKALAKSRGPSQLAGGNKSGGSSPQGESLMKGDGDTVPYVENMLEQPYLRFYRVFPKVNNGVLFRIVNDHTRLWSYYNDSPNYVFRVKVVFYRDSVVHVVGQARDITREERDRAVELSATGGASSVPQRSLGDSPKPVQRRLSSAADTSTANVNTSTSSGSAAPTETCVFLKPELAGDDSACVIMVDVAPLTTELLVEAVDVVQFLSFPRGFPVGTSLDPK